MSTSTLTAPTAEQWLRIRYHYDLIASFNDSLLAAVQASAADSANTWTELQTFTTGLLVQDSGVIKFGTPGTDVLLTSDGTDLVASGTGDIVLVDNFHLKIGTGKDLSLRHNGTNSFIANTTGNLVIDSQSATGFMYMDLGTDTSATGWAVRNDSGSSLLAVNGLGVFAFAMPDNTTVAGGFYEGATPYLTFKTTNGSETVEIGKQLLMSGGIAPGSRFKSSELTGTGSPQTVAHGLGTTPSLYWHSLSLIGAGGATLSTVSADATNITFTLTSGAKIYWMALK